MTIFFFKYTVTHASWLYVEQKTNCDDKEKKKVSTASHVGLIKQVYKAKTDITSSSFVRS